MPLDPNVKLSKDDCPATVEGATNRLCNCYQEVVRKLLYAATQTRPDIAFASPFLLQFLVKPGKAHLGASFRVIRYLKSARDYRLTYGKTKTGFYSYSDAAHESQKDRYSTSGFGGR